MLPTGNLVGWESGDLSSLPSMEPDTPRVGMPRSKANWQSGPVTASLSVARGGRRRADLKLSHRASRSKSAKVSTYSRTTDHRSSGGICLCRLPPEFRRVLSRGLNQPKCRLPRTSPALSTGTPGRGERGSRRRRAFQAGGSAAAATTGLDSPSDAHSGSTAGLVFRIWKRDRPVRDR